MASPNDPNAVAAADDTPSFSKQLESATVKIVVGWGKKQKEFSVHLDVICRKAPKFGEMLKDDSQRGYKKMLQLPENDPAVFGVFMTWLYQDIIEKPTDSAEEVKRERLLIKLVAFAEKYNISDLADSTLDFLINFFSDIRQFPSGATTYVYKSTQTGSRLRRLYTKSLAFLTLKRGCKNWVDNYLCATLKSHKDILPDYIEELIVQSRIKLVNPLKLPACTFHGHGKDEPCAIASKKRKRAVDNE